MHTHTHTHTHTLTHAQVLFNVCDIPCDFELPPYISRMLAEMAEVRRKRPHFDAEAEVVVHHYSYAGICALKPLKAHQYAVTRSMYETDSLVTLLSHCCCTVVALLLHCCCTVVTLLLHCCCTVVALLLHCCCTVVALLLHTGA
jgi:hypothetical protein